MYNFSNQTDNNGNTYIQILYNNSTIHLACDDYMLQRIINQDDDRFVLRHNNLNVIFEFTRDEVATPASIDSQDLQDKLADIFNCCVCVNSQNCDDCPNDCNECPNNCDECPNDCPCLNLPGTNVFFWDFTPDNPLNDGSVANTNITIGQGNDCENLCVEYLSGVDIVSESVLNFCEQLVESTPEGLQMWYDELEGGTVRLYISTYDRSCCGEPQQLFSNTYGCQEGPFEFDFMIPSNPDVACCSQDLPCQYSEIISPGEAFFTIEITNLFPAGAYNPTSVVFQTSPGDCFGINVGNLPPGAYNQSTFATAIYDALYTQIGNGIGAQIIDVTIDSNIITVILDMDNCCGISMIAGSTSGPTNAVLNNTDYVVITEILCC